MYAVCKQKYQFCPSQANFLAIITSFNRIYFFFFVNFFYCKKRMSRLRRGAPCLFEAHILSAIPGKGTIKFYGKPHAAKLP